jgi:hypothetical protein
MDWHEPFAISEDNPIRTSRVDIGVFANNGVHDSAPAILSMKFPSHETRVYAPGPDGHPRIASIDHADPARARSYADPMLMAWANWHDDYAYAADGTPLGWTRTRPAPRSARPAPRPPDGAPDLQLPGGRPRSPTRARAGGSGAISAHSRSVTSLA